MERETNKAVIVAHEKRPFSATPEEEKTTEKAPAANTMLEKNISTKTRSKICFD
jgi:hypothetical protein